MYVWYIWFKDFSKPNYSWPMSSDFIGRVNKRRERERVTRDDSGDDARGLQRRTEGLRAQRRHRDRASSSESDTDGGSSATESGSESDTSQSGANRRTLKKRQPAARNARQRAEKDAERMKKLKALKEKRRQDEAGRDGDGRRRKRGESDDGPGGGGRMSLDVDEKDIVNDTIIELEDREEFFKMHGYSASGMGDSSSAALFAASDFPLSMEAEAAALAAESGRGAGGRAAAAKRRKKSWVYVESASTGRFKKVSMHRLGYSRLADRDADAEDGRSGGRSRTGPDLMDHRTHGITAFVAGVFQCAQGLLAGLALLHLFLVQSVTALGTFESVYQPLAPDSRRLYFVLASLALASSLDSYLREAENKELWATLSPLQKARVLLIGLLYSLVMLFTLLMMPTDGGIAKKPTDVAAGDLANWLVYETMR